jgi:hypothetical protein
MDSAIVVRVIAALIGVAILAVIVYRRKRA